MKKFLEQPLLLSESKKETPQPEPPAAEKEEPPYRHPSNQDYTELTATLGERELSPENEIIRGKDIPGKVKKAIEEIETVFLLPKKRIRLKNEKRS